MIGPIETFQTEAKEHLGMLESALLELENDPRNAAIINEAFRSIHTIKGAGGMYGYQDLTNFTHHLETVLDKIRCKEIVINSALIGIFLDAGDLMQGLLQDPNFSPNQHTLTQNLLNRLHDTVGIITQPWQAKDIQDQHTSSSKPAAFSDENSTETDLHTFVIRFIPDTDTFINGLDVVPILRELHSYGECIVFTDMSKMPTMSDLRPQQCYLSWEVTLLTKHTKDTVLETFMFVEDDWQISIEEQQTDALSDDTNQEINHAIDQLVSRETEQNTGQSVTPMATASAPIKNKELDETIRVPARRLDSLMNLMGELVIVQARLNQVAGLIQNEHVNAIAEELEMLTTQMRDETFGIRMMPIGSTFSRFKRVVRDLSTSLHKKIVLSTFGAETELDKMVLDKLSDPLIHLIRNSIDHGIESPEQRLAKSKPETGSISLSARHVDSHVIITISDDGKGLDTDSILAKALAKGVIDTSDGLSDTDIHMLIFEPGLSTAETVSDVSGRGVGMDVVKRSITDLGGKISLESRPNQGTTLSINLPMTLAIIEGLMVKVDKEHYVLPLSYIEECIELPEVSHKHSAKHGLVEVRGEQIPYLNLRQFFKATTPAPKIEQVVVAHIGAQKFGFCVDEVIGQYQTVIKRLGKLYEGVAGFSGATIMGDGTVAMVLDPQALMESSEKR